MWFRCLGDVEISRAFQAKRFVDLFSAMNVRLRHSNFYCLVGFTAFTVCGVAAPAAPFSLLVNGQPTPIDPPPIIQDREVYLPVEVLSHSLGIAVLPTKVAGMWVVSFYGQNVYVRANTTRYIRDGIETEATFPPLMQGGQLYLPVSTLAANFPFEVNGPFANGLELTGPNATVQSVRQGSHPDYVRMVIDVSAAAPFRWSVNSHSLTITVSGERGATDGVFQSMTFPEAMVPEVIQEPAVGGGTMILIGHHCPTDVLVFTLSDPYRIVIDFPRKPPEVPGPLQAPEDLDYNRQTPWTVHKLMTSRGVAVAYSVTLPVGQGKATLIPALAGSTIHSRRTVSAIALAANAYVAINGGFFAPNGNPLGMLVIDGEWIKEPMLGRTVLGVMQDGSLKMGNVRFASRIILPGAGAVTIDHLNAGHADSDDVVLYTRRWGDATAEKTEPKATRVMIAQNGQVQLVNTEGRGMVIPPGGYVLSAVGPRAAQIAKAQVGGMATLQLGTDPPWPGLRHALGGGPRLVANGCVYVTSSAESFRADVAVGAAPRSAVGIMPNGDALLMVVDGRQAGYSAGMTLGELAEALVKLGVKDAMNLDGGGSSTLVVRGRLANRPSDGAQRLVSNALLGLLR
ncbi:MAG: phosphodiester glycosidase family protein [Candidatus Zipacnadales bacterium]